MCLLIDNSKGVALDRNILETAATRNPHGYGRLCLLTGRVKRTLDMDEAVELAMQPGPAIHHFRWATVGGKSLSNCHPFPVNNGYYLFQNGSADIFHDDGRTDTQNLADLLRLVNVEHRSAFLTKLDQRYILVNSKSHKVIRTGKGWVERDGVWYSNDYCLPNGHLVAVYGTLKSGQGNNHFLDEAELVDWGLTAEPHRLCIKGLPFLIEGGDGDNVEVEVYSVSDSTLLRLDQLEGHPNCYERRKTSVILDNGNTVTAWIYFAKEDRDTGEYHTCYGESWLGQPDLDDMCCPDCSSDDIQTDPGYIYCNNCFKYTSDIREDLWARVN